MGGCHLNYKMKIGIYTIILLMCVSLSCASVLADDAALSVVPDTIVYGTNQTLTIIGSDTKFLGFGESLLPVIEVGFVAEDGTVITIPAEVISNYAVHVADLSVLLPGVYAMEVRNENMDAERLTDVSLTITAAPAPINENSEEITDQKPMTNGALDTALINEDAGRGADAPVLINENSEEVTEQKPMTNDALDTALINEESGEVVESELAEFTEIEQNPEPATTQIVITYILTMNVGPGGSILSSFDESIGRIVLSIMPDEGYKIDDVVVDDESVGAVGEYVFESVQANHAITATFEMIPVVEHCISANAGPNGSIMPEGIICVPEGSFLEFMITAHEGSVIADLLVDGAFIGASDSYVMDSIFSDHSITAFFATIPVVNSCITAVAGNGGQIIPSGEVCSVGDVTFSMVPDEGYAVADVLVDNIFIGPVLEYTIAEPTQDHMIFVSFVQR